MASKRFIYYILAAFIAANLLLIFVQYNSIKNINTLIAGNEKTVNEFKVEAELRDLRKNIIALEAAISEAVNTKDTLQISNLQLEINAVESNLGKLQKVDDNDSSVHYIDQLDKLVHTKILLYNHVLEAFNHRGKKAADLLIANGREEEITDSIIAVTHKIDSSRRQLLTAVTASIDKSGQRARSWGSFLFILVACSGAALFWFIINRVRQQNHLILQLNASEKKVKEAAKLKENFMANMSHEIRTPMNAIIGFTGLLQHKKLDENASLYVQSIQTAGQNLLTIINDILDFSKFEAGMMRIEPVTFSIRTLLQSLDTMFQQKAKEKNISLTITVNQQVPDLLEADAARITQILINLVGNAIKFTHSGTVSVAANNLAVTDNVLQLSFTVADTGIGIHENSLPYIFERFRQAEDSTTRFYGGTGLGLSIVKDLVALQQGSISVTSEPGKGSTFSVTIPCKIVAHLPATATVTALNNSAPADFLPATILIVEDNELNQLLMARLLQQWNLKYIPAANGLQAIKLLKEQKFDLVLMDIQMPAMDGYAATLQIRQTLQLQIPIIAITANALAGEREKCLVHGMNDYISKPIHEKELLAIISRFIQPAAGTANQKNSSTQHIYQHIRLEYLHEISNGDTAYEKMVTALFIETIPADLQALENAVQLNDCENIRQLAHNMKTTVSVMGLEGSLQPSLDMLEYESMDKISCRKNIATLKQSCNSALQEARLFLATL